MPDYLLMRAEDHVVLGVTWSGLVVSGSGADGLPVLEALDGAWLVLTFPPQHLAEETSPRGSAAPLTLPVGPGGGAVPVWRAVLSGPSRLAFDLAPGTRLVPTVEGVLGVLSRRQLRHRSGGTPGPGDTAVELPWRLILSPQGPAASRVVSVHPSRPMPDEAGLWRSRIVVEPGGPRGESGGTGPEPHGTGHELDLFAVDRGLAAADDPAGFTVPLGRDDRVSISIEAARRPARARRLELSALGGTLVARGVWENYLWEHHAVLGRDMSVRTLATGRLYPLGHRAEYQQFTERRFDPDAAGAAVLRQLHVLTVTEPVRGAPTDGPAYRAFPFDRAEIVTRSYPDLEPAAWQSRPVPGLGPTPTHFWPTSRAGQRVLFPIRCATPDGDITFHLPLIFVRDWSPAYSSLTDPGLAQQLHAEYGRSSVAVPGQRINLAGSASRHAGDVHEVHRLTIEGSLHSTGYRPRLHTLDIALPALRSLLNDERARPVRFAGRYLERGEVEDVLLELAGDPIDVTFVGRADRSGGLVAPRYLANAISRTLGPVNRHALPGTAPGPIDPATLFPADATLLGFRLSELVTQLSRVPQLTAQLRSGRPPLVQMVWTDVRLQSRGPFEATADSRLRLVVTHSDTGTETTCTITGFALRFPVTRPLLRLRFTELSCTQRGGEPPRVTVGDVNAEFLGDLQLLEELQNHVRLAGLMPRIDATSKGVEARYCLPLPPVSAGAFVMKNVVVSAGITVPFDGRPVSVALGFASRANPFALTVLAFGGGGYLELLVDHRGLRRLEAALEFGALIEVDFLVARAEVHALGGISFVLDERDGSVVLTGYLRIGGCVQILGLLSVSVELTIAMTYRSATKALVGRATLVLEIDLWLWSESVELDTGEWVLAGGGATRRAAFADTAAPALYAALQFPADRERPADVQTDDDGLQRWREYRAAFAHQPFGGTP
ncbi:hypothetical protein [Micromonospora sp. NPDC051296]|uniref:hypothetical protein n=1 Tax=Micromonospora sp. NPDC051296 TaxID=3155046 RepID=UPI003440958A